MIDTESGKPKARARTIRRWIAAIVVLVIIVVVAYVLGWIPRPGAHATAALAHPMGTAAIADRLYP